MIKKLTYGMAALSLLSVAAIAGPMPTVDKNPVAPCTPFYADHEFSVQIFGMGEFRTGTPNHAVSVFDGSCNAGAGGEVQYFFTRNMGFGIEGDWLDMRDNGGAVAGNFYLRAPLSECSPLAPYLMGGVGGLFFGTDTHNDTFDTGHHSNNKFEGHVGAGLEYRFTQHIGAFVDGRFMFVNDSNEHTPKFGEVRGGFKYAF